LLSHHTSIYEEIFFRQRRLDQEAVERRMSWEEARAVHARYEGHEGVAFIAPYAKTLDQLHDVRRSDTGELVGDIAHRSLGRRCVPAFSIPNGSRAIREVWGCRHIGAFVCCGMSPSARNQNHRPAGSTGDRWCARRA
jgi:hypothetical protein